MRTTTLRLHVDGRDVAPLWLADSYWRRARGLLGTRSIPGALLLRPGNSVHGMGMLYALDVALLDDEATVLHVLTLRPFGLTRPRPGVRQVLEANRGSFSRWGLRVGSRITAHDNGNGR
ncbi:hypothetical protein Kisp01_08770 [Kineosporia sp. NBRC 101677]|uniref:DUF192 domain-containing protein n=1 Tax=Kineosporia sp. NBRC 101677 TaxID=3032197 RepID=UPI0024A331E4|nr:DUF192 domain-containing protein [Kineosporia sp. NBRC 101677]GLY13861.1 hypothetical protein Kisp01_08770 [Kineosporia sp. NBRC 101677]